MAPPLLTIETYRPYIFSLQIPGIDLTLEPRFYGLFYAISIILGYKILSSEAKRRHLPMSEDDAMNGTLYIFLGGLLGGRIYEVIFEWENYYSAKPWWEIFAIWHGGLAIHGGILGGTLAVYYYAKAKKLRFFEVADIGALGMILGQAIGRWGNFTNGEAAGPVTDFWSGVVFPPGSPTDRYAQGQPVHPTMIYESLGNFLIFAILWKLRLKNFRPGMLLALHFILYSFFRMFLTPLRMDNQYLEIFGVKVLAPYMTGILLIMAAILLIWKGKLWKTEPPIPLPQPAPPTPRRSSKKKHSKNR